jgi:hypothetical protein
LKKYNIYPIPQEYIPVEEIKANHHEYDNVVLPVSFESFGKKIADYVELEEPQDFETFKTEMEDFYRVYLSE